MLAKDQERLYSLSDADRSFYRMLLPREHPLLDALELIDWQAFVPELESHYCPDMGQPAIPPLLMLKLELLRYFCRLSDREVIARSQTDVLFRWFLQIPVRCKLPDASLLTKFRGRLGVEGFKKLFDRLVTCARDANLIRDRLCTRRGQRPTSPKLRVLPKRKHVRGQRQLGRPGRESLGGISAVDAN